MTTYRIPSWNVSDFESKMNRFTNKAKKLNIPFGFTLESKETVKVIDPLTAWDSYRTDYIYSVYGESPTIAGYTFLAKLERMGNDNLIHSHNTTFDFTNYRECELICEHCKINRSRNFYYLIQSESGEVKIVGGNCLANYINLPNAEDIAKFYGGSFELIKSYSDEENASEKFNTGKTLLKIESFLPYAIQSINKQGYKKSDSDNPTKYDSLNRYFVPKEKLTDFEIEEAKKILSYVQNKLNEKMVNAKNNNMFGITEYDITLLKLIEYGYMSEKHSGYIVSIIPMYHRMVEKELTIKNQPESNHLGEVGTKLNNINAKVIRYNQIENNYNGVTHLYTFDSDGSIITYFASKSFDIEAGDNVNIIIATIKKLDSFNCKKQTVIIRGKIEKI